MHAEIIDEEAGLKHATQVIHSDKEIVTHMSCDLPVNCINLTNVNYFELFALKTNLGSIYLLLNSICATFYFILEVLYTI